MEFKMKLEEIKKFIADNKDNEDVQGYLKELKKDGLIDFVKSDEGYKMIKPFVDSKVTEGISTFEAKTLPKKLQDQLDAKLPEYEKEFKTKYGVKDPEDPKYLDMAKKLEAIEKERNQERAEKVKLEKLNAVRGVTAKKGFEVFSDLLLDEDVDKSVAKAQWFVDQYDEHLKQGINEILKTGKKNPDKGIGGGGKELTDEEAAKLPPADYDKYRKDVLGLKD
jgi:hypothetical protein